MKSLKELEELRRSAREAIELRQREGKTRIVIGMGTCGIAAGAREVMSAILDELAKRKLTNVVVSQTGCIGLCVKEPLVEVILPGQPKVSYGNIDGRRARQIVAQHVVNGVIVRDWAIGTSTA